VIDVPAARRTSTNTRGQVVRASSGAESMASRPRAGSGPIALEFAATIRGVRPIYSGGGIPEPAGDDLLAVPRPFSVNFHAALLPAYRGLHPVFRALRAGERWAGLTVHVVDAGLDTGDILYQVRVRTRRDDSVESLYDRIMDRCVGLVGQLITDADAGRLHPRAQGAAGASYFSSVGEEDFRIDWQCAAEQLRRWVRATPGRCFCDTADERVYFSGAELSKGAGGTPGTLIGVGRRRCTVAAGEGALDMVRIRTREGELPAAVWCRNRGLKAGETPFLPMNSSFQSQIEMRG
jgi:methionyl-tRNA formyltransferase